MDEYIYNFPSEQDVRFWHFLRVAHYFRTKALLNCSRCFALPEEVFIALIKCEKRGGANA